MTVAGLPGTVTNAVLVADMTQVMVEIQSDGEVAEIITTPQRLVDCTVLGKDSSLGVLLGWGGAGYVYPQKAFDRSSPMASFFWRYPHSSDRNFDRFYILDSFAEVVIPFGKGGGAPAKAKPVGATCRRCGSRNEWAEANRPDGSYLCFECRP